MASVNKVTIIGRIGKDPEIRHTQSGQTVATMSVATDESYKDQSGQKVEKTEWHKIVVWGKQADFVANYLGKGRLVYVEGKLETRKWQDQSGQDRYSTEIVLRPYRGELTLLDGRGEGGGGAGGSYEGGYDEGPSYGGGGGGRSAPASSGGGGFRNNDLDDEIPF